MTLSTFNKPLLRELQQIGLLSSDAIPQMASENLDKVVTEVFNGDGTGVKYALNYPYPYRVVSALAFPHDGTAGGRNIKLLVNNTDYKITDGSNFKNIVDLGVNRVVLTYISN
jgi:hypothetical protein